jgi:uncharacterized protein YdhG (YjbR/CyaY superfamily)
MREPKMKKTNSKAKSKASPKNIDEYLATVPEPARSTLKKTREVIRSVVPAEATEAISYGMPAFRYKGLLVYFAAFSDHCSLFPTAAVIRAFENELKHYQTSKGTIRFAVDKPLSTPLLKKLMRARVAQVELKK